MPRDGESVRKRLQWSALELFSERGYEETTAAQIAANAGVTERTFFRHFPDKREVLFDGDNAFTEAVTTAVRKAPKTLGPWEALFLAFKTVTHILVENRSFTEPRQGLIASSAALQERSTAKSRTLVASVARALGERGMTETQSNLAAQIGMAIISHGVQAWFKDGSIDLEEHVVRSLHDASGLFPNNLETVNAKQKQRTARRS